MSEAAPAILPDGRILYTRWEYTDIAHAFSARLFTMNPDGTNQRAYYGTNSFWPNSIFYARPIPDHPTQVVGVVGGHHDHPRMGELVIFDPARGRFEADGVVQRIPGYKQEVKPIIGDGIVNGTEECDGDNTLGEVCADQLTMQAGRLGCGRAGRLVDWRHATTSVFSTSAILRAGLSNRAVESTSKV